MKDHNYCPYIYECETIKPIDPDLCIDNYKSCHFYNYFEHMRETKLILGGIETINIHTPSIDGEQINKMEVI